MFAFASNPYISYLKRTARALHDCIAIKSLGVNEVLLVLRRLFTFNYY